MRTVRIEPASDEDARVIATVLEDICPWPGYRQIARTLQPWIFELEAQHAAALMARLYSDGVDVKQAYGNTVPGALFPPVEPPQPAPAAVAVVEEVPAVAEEPVRPAVPAQVVEAKPAPGKKAIPAAKARTGR